MAEEADRAELLTPDEAFAQLGNETRVEILRILGTAAQPLQFSDLYDRTDVADSGQFNYHLSKLVGQFVTKSEDGYTLSRMGRRVVEAVLSGAVTDTPALERTEIDEPCEYCGAPIEVGWEEGNVRQFCTECAGQYGRAYSGATSTDASEGYLGRLPLPPAGVHGRSPTEILHAARIAGTLEIYALSEGVCPRCAATIEQTVKLCEEHTTGEELCANCQSRYATGVSFECTNCIYQAGGGGWLALLTNERVIEFLVEHGLNPVGVESMTAVNRVHNTYDEDVRSTDPLEVEFTFHLDGDALSLTVDEALNMIECRTP
jgi:DNA-binding transcriptional ArsR family regulator